MNDNNNFLFDCGCFDSVKNDADNVVSSLFSGSKLFLFSKKALDDLREDYLNRMFAVYSQIIQPELQNVILNSDIDLNDYKSAAEKFALISSGGSYEYFINKYPVFKQYKDNIKNNFIHSITQFYERFLSCRDLISQNLFNGKKINEIAGLKIYDAHTRHGQAAVKIQTNAGTVYYKPHNGNIDLLYEKIISLYFHDCTLTPKIIAQDGYYFAAEIVPSALNSEREAADYFYNFGAMSALFLGMGSGDIGFQNIIPCGKFPVVIDVEVLMRAETPKSFRAKSCQDNNDLYYSLLRTSIMPTRGHSGTISSPLYIVEKNKSHLPYFGEKFFTVENYERDFINGFNDGYKRMMKYSGEILKLVEAQENITIRFVMNNSHYYYLIMKNLFTSASMSSLEGQAEAIKKIGVVPSIYESEETLAKIIDYEADCMKNGDVPYYCIDVKSRNLYSSDTLNLFHENYFYQSPFEMLKMKLARLSEAEFNFESDLIKNCFAQIALDCEIPDKFKISGKTCSKEKMKSAVIKIYEDLRKYIIHGTDGLPLWLCPVLTLESIPNANVISWSSVALFCSRLKNCEWFHESKSAEELVNLCLKALDRQIKLWLRIDAPSEIFDGLDELILTLAKINANDLLAEIEELIIAKKLFESEKANEIILSLLLSEKVDSLKYFIDKINNNLPEKLDALAKSGLIFAGAYKFTGDKKFADLSSKVFNELREKYSDRVKGWPEGKFLWLGDKSPYSGIIAYCSLYAEENEVSELALKSICLDENLLHKDAIINGNASSIFALIKAHKKFADREYLDKAGEIISAMIERAQGQSFIVMPEGIRSSFDPSFFHGTLGVGCALIEFIESL